MSAPNSTSPTHIAFLDELRGIAILMVVALHAQATAYGYYFHDAGYHGLLPVLHFPLSYFLSLPLVMGWAGVPVFFVVSGFCIHLAHQKSRDRSFRTFFLRRFFRIYPPYLVALVFFAVVFLPTRLDYSSSSSKWDFLSHLFLLHNLDAHYLGSICGSFWSIAVEAQLYLLYPFLLWLVRRWGWRRALIVTCLIEFAFAGVGSLLLKTPLAFIFIRRCPFVYWFSWSIGAKIADDWLNQRPIFLARMPLLPWIALALVTFATNYLEVFSFTFSALVAACILARSLSSSWPATQRWPWLGRHLQFAGVVSYSVYLLHQPLIEVTPGALAWIRPGAVFPAWMVMLICLAEWPLLLAVAYLYYRFLEQPSIALGKAILNRESKRAAALGATGQVSLP